MGISINDLPKYSIWPHRLLGLTEWEKKSKSAIEVLREFDREKWGSLLNYVESSKVQLSLKQIEKYVYDESSELICLDNQKLLKLSAYAAFKEQYKIILNTISNKLPIKALCELGAGYGQIILNIANEKKFFQIPLIATEYASSGVQLIKYLSASLSNIKVGKCDLNSSPITNVQIPNEAVIFTSFAAMYIPEFSNSFVENVSSFKPSLIIHFEPIYEHCNKDTLLGSMQRKYMELNDYNRNLLSILKEAESNDLIKIVIEQPQVFGSNPFLPMSIVAWKPVKIK